jgi:hypothetical protein
MLHHCVRVSCFCNLSGGKAYTQYGNIPIQNNTALIAWWRKKITMDKKLNEEESLLDRTADFGKLSILLAKLKAIDKTADYASSILSHCVTLAFAATFLLLLNVGASIWLGGIIGCLAYGFFAVSAFYAFVAAIAHFFFQKMIKRKLADSIVQQFVN